MSDNWARNSMDELNGFLSGNPQVEAAFSRLQAKNEARFKDLEDAMLVHAHLEASASKRIKEHAGLLADHHEAIERHEEWMKHFEGKLNALTNIMMRRSGGPETQ